MKLLAIVLCLLSERYLIHRFSYARFYWFKDYLLKIAEMPIAKSLNSTPWLLLLLVIAPFVLLSGLLLSITDNWLYGLVHFLLSMMIFYYCIGPVNPFYPLRVEDLDDEEQVGYYFYLVNRQLFSPIFWFILTGPIGVLTYRTISLCQDFGLVSKEAKMMTDILEWLPIRMTAFLCMLVGNFQQGVLSFKSLFFSNYFNNYAFLSCCAVPALRSHADDIITVPLAQRVIEQALIVLLVILALCTVAGF